MKHISEKTIVVIDYEEHTRGGHFAHWLMFFAREFAKRFDRVLVCTPDPELTARLFKSSGEALPAAITFPGIPVTWKKIFSRRRRKRALGTIFRDARRLAPTGRLCGFVMWGYDLLEKGAARNPGRIPWGALVPLSWEHRNSNHGDSAKDVIVRELCQNRPDCAGVMTPDNFIVSPELKKSLWVPVMQDLRLPVAVPAAVAEARRLAGGRPIVGATGLLDGARCVNELLRLSLQNPDLFFFLAGSLNRDSVDADLLEYLEPGKKGNVFLVEGFLEEPELNAMINAMDMVFIDGLNYPVHSSVVVKALNFGKFILTPESNSWTRDAVHQWKVGMCYTSRPENVHDEWEKWQTSGGPERARGAAGELMSAAALAACFDEMTRALLKQPSHGNLRP